MVLGLGSPWVFVRLTRWVVGAESWLGEMEKAMGWLGGCWDESDGFGGVMRWTDGMARSGERRSWGWFGWQRFTTELGVERGGYYDLCKGKKMQ